MDPTKYAQEDSYKEKTSNPRRRCQPSTTIKTSIPSQIKVRRIHPSSGTLELWTRNFSNLIVGGYLAGTIPVLVLKSSAFVLCRFLSGTREDRVAHWWFFQHHQLASSVGNTSNQSLLYPWDKRSYGPNSIDGISQPRNWKSPPLL